MIPSILPYMATIIALFTLASASLPEQVFWDNDWPSDLISLGEFNNGDDSDKKVLDFLPLEKPHVIQGLSNLNEISNDPKAEVLKTIFNDDDNNGEVEVKTGDGSWIKEFYLPDALDIPNLSEFQLTCASSWSVKIHYNNGTTRSVSYGKYLVLAVLNGVWITEDEYDPTPSPSAAPTPFNDKLPLLLKGTVLFAQSQIIPSKHGIDGDSQPHLTALRKTLVMLRPQIETTEDEEEVMLKMTVRDMDKKVISSDIEMKAPNDIPKQDGWIELGNVDPDDIEFPSSLIDPYVIKNIGNLNLIKDDKKATVLTDIMNKNQAEVEIKTWNGSWVRDIYLPDGSTIPADSKIQVTCNSGFAVYMHYPNTQTGGWRSKKITNGQKLVFILVNNVWLSEGDLGHNRYVFGHRFFTAMLKEEWVQQGMSIEFTAISNSDEKDKVGVLHKIEIGGETELVITAIDAGFLTPPRNQFKFRDDESAHTEYFQTIPVSRLVVVQYESMHMTEIMLPSGKFYTDSSDDEGGWHSGDMRQHIGKILMSHGIDLANYGISSSKGDSESSHPFTCALLAGHNTVGMYKNGRIVHGGSGGNGVITLDQSIGNEFSHEVGHNYGLGHYVGGFKGSVHSPSDKINSSWGWDSQTNVFLPNFDSNDSGKDQCLDDECQSPFMGKYRYGTDSMAGGSPNWANRFTMYTPYVAKIIQSFFEGKAVWDPTSSTGFRKFDLVSKKMKEFVNNDNGKKVPTLYRVPVTTIIGYYDPSPTRGLKDYVYPAMHGAYGFVYKADGGSSTGTAKGCELVVETNDGNGKNALVYKLGTDIHNVMNKFHVNIATDAKPYRATINCFNQLRASRDLDGLRQNEPPLTYTVNGIAFNDGGDGDTPTASPTTGFPTTGEPTAAPTAACSVHVKFKNCKRDKINRCKWQKRSRPKCVSQPCQALTKKSQCKKGGCKWLWKQKKCVEK